MHDERGRTLSLSLPRRLIGDPREGASQRLLNGATHPGTDDEPWVRLDEMPQELAVGRAPVGIFMWVLREVDRVSGAGEVVEVSSLDRFADFLIDQRLPAIHHVNYCTVPEARPLREGNLR